MILSLGVRNKALLEEILAGGREEARAKEGQAGIGRKQQGRGGLDNSVKCLRGCLGLRKEAVVSQHDQVGYTNLQGRTGTRLAAMRGGRREIDGGREALWLMADCREVVVEEGWEEEVFVGEEAYS